jgi:hypothetical protein
MHKLAGLPHDSSLETPASVTSQPFSSCDPPSRIHAAVTVLEWSRPSCYLHCYLHRDPWLLTCVPASISQQGRQDIPGDHGICDPDRPPLDRLHVAMRLYSIVMPSQLAMDMQVRPR